MPQALGLLALVPAVVQAVKGAPGDKQLKKANENRDMIFKQNASEEGPAGMPTDALGGPNVTTPGAGIGGIGGIPSSVSSGGTNFMPGGPKMGPMGKSMFGNGGNSWNR